MISNCSSKSVQAYMLKWNHKSLPGEAHNFHPEGGVGEDQSNHSHKVISGESRRLTSNSSVPMPVKVLRYSPKLPTVILRKPICQSRLVYCQSIHVAVTQLAAMRSAKMVPSSDCIAAPVLGCLLLYSSVLNPFTDHFDDWRYRSRRCQ